MVLFNIVFCCMFGLTMSATVSYKAGVVTSSLSDDAHASLIRDAARSNVDILMLPSPRSPEIGKSSTADNYDKVVKTISTAAKEHSMYVVTHLFENVRCQEKTELIRSNLVFNRQGSIISVYRKPMDTRANCNVTATEIGSIITDFGVTFGVLMAEDMVLQNLEGLKDVKNFVLAGDWQSKIPVLAAPQFFTTWAYTTNANLVSTSGIFAGKAGLSGKGADVIVAELNNDGDASSTHPASIVNTSHFEDLSQYTVKPLDLAASSHGVSETVCHGKFCCQFFVKTSSIDPESLNYGLAAFEGIRHYGGPHHIGTQNCALLPCVGSYKRSCDVESVNKTEIIFDKVTITAYFKLQNSAQYPIILSTDTSSNNRFQFNKKCINNTNEVTVQLYDGKKLLNFGIFGRDFTKDYESKTIVYENGLTYNLSDYVNGEDVFDFFDYLWIKLRIPIFIASIYILEMM